MSEWWTYRLTSFLLFSPRTYYRLLELYNLAIWPAQLAGMAIGLAIVALLIGKRGHRERAIAGVAVLALVRGRIRWLLLVIPVLWCAVTAATLWAMHAPESLFVVAAGLLALWPAVAGTRRDAPDGGPAGRL